MLGDKDPKKNVWGEIHHRIADKLKNELKSRCLIQIPRYHIKSTLVTQNWVLQELEKDRSLRVLIASAEQTKAEGFLYAIKSNIMGEKFISRFGDIKDSEVWTKDRINVLGRDPGIREKSIMTASIGTDVTSLHFDLIVLDDLVTRKFTRTAEQRQKASDFYMDCLDLLSPEGRLVVIGTRWHLADLYSELAKQKGIFDFIVDEPQMFNPHFHRRDFKSMIDHDETTYLFPALWDRHKTKAKYKEKLSKPGGFMEFACQQMNFPVSDENSPFKFENINFVWDYPSSVTIFQTIDPAGADKLTRRQDDTAIATSGIDVNLDLYNIDMWSDKTTNTGLFSRAYQQFAKYINNIRKVGIEKNFNAANKLYLEREYPDMAKKLVGYRAGNANSKEERMLALQPYVENGKFYIVQHKDAKEYTIGEKVLKITPGQYKLIMQMIDFGSTVHDDALDAQAATLEFIPKPRSQTVDPKYSWEPTNERTGY